MTAVKRAVLALLIAGAAGWGLTGGPAQAQDSPAVASEEMMLFQEIPSVYGASKYEQKVTEAPSSVSIITADDIRKFGYRTLADVLRSVRSFHITFDRNYSYVGVRGFSRPGDYNSRVLLLIDGHRANDNIYDGALVGTEGVLDVDLIDRIEVIRGPGSSLYGSNAFFAVVNVITKRGRDYKGVEASGEAASFDTRKGRLSYGDRYGSGWEALVSASAFDSKGQSFFYPEFDAPATNNGVTQHTDNDKYGNAFAKVSYRDFTFTGVASSRTKRIPTGSFGADFNDPRNQTEDRRSYGDLLYERRVAPRTDFSARVFYDYYSYWGDYVYSGVMNRDQGFGLWWGGELRVVTSVNVHRVIAGAEYQDNVRQDQRNYDEAPIPAYLDDRRSSQRSALYAQDEIALSRAVTLNAGARYDHYDTFGGTVNPRLAFIYAPVEKSSFKLLYGSAFRAPNVYELYYASPTSTPPMVGNPNLNPEKIATYELVCEQYVGDHFRGTAAAYYYLIRDLINETIDAAGNAVFENIARVRTRGFELELENKWANGLDGRASYTFQQSEDATTGEVLTNSPRHLAKLNIAVPLVASKVFVGIEEQYTSRRKTVGGNFAPGFLVTNLTLFSQRLIGRLEASASVYNLFDKFYGDPVSPDHLQDTIGQDGRNYRGKLTYRF
jgi:iron complex outermembrane receptor protein